MLSNRAKIEPILTTALQMPRKHVSFYRRYAFFVGNTLRKPLFQRFLRWLLKTENIDKRLIANIQIEVLPYQKKNGNSLAGRRSRDGNILIFPKSFEFFKELVAKHGPEITRSYVKSRACATLIHEILHAKYASDEEKVRRLTKRYFGVYAKSPKTEDFDNVIFTILFKQ